MERVGKSVGLEPVELLAAREADREGLRASASGAGSPHNWLSQAYPAVASGCPSDWSEQDLTSQTSGWYADAEERLVLCQSCPRQGGACERSHTLFSPGVLPVWQGRALAAAPCPRFREFVLCRRLTISAVPARHQGATFAAYEVSTPLQEAALTALATFFQELASGRAPWLILEGASSSGKTHLACALLRNLPTKLPQVRFFYADLNELRPAVRAHNFADSDPLERVRDTGLLVLDNVDAKNKAPREDYVRTRLEDTLYARWTRARATLITTHGSRTALAEMFPAISGMDGVPACRLA